MMRSLHSTSPPQREREYLPQAHPEVKRKRRLKFVRAPPSMESMAQAILSINHFADADATMTRVNDITSNLTPVFACGPAFGPGGVALIYAWIATLPLALVNLIVTIYKCRGNHLAGHLGILAIATLGTLSMFSPLMPEPSFSGMALVVLVAVPIVIASQFVVLVFHPRRRDPAKLRSIG
jgi:hypothetical protein